MRWKITYVIVLQLDNDGTYPVSEDEFFDFNWRIYTKRSIFSWSGNSTLSSLLYAMPESNPVLWIWRQRQFGNLAKDCCFVDSSTASTSMNLWRRDSKDMGQPYLYNTLSCLGRYNVTLLKSNDLVGEAFSRFFTLLVIVPAKGEISSSTDWKEKKNIMNF